MARRIRRSMSRPDRAWLTGINANALTYNDSTPVRGNLTTMWEFSDTDVDENLQGERSNWVLERLLGWYHWGYFSPNGGLDGPFQASVCMTIGVFETEPDAPLADVIAQEGPFDVVDQWARLIYTDIGRGWNQVAQFYDANQLIVAQDATVDIAAFPVPIHDVHRFDLRPNLRLRDTSAMGMAVGPAQNLGGTFDGAVFAATLFWKALFRKSAV